jgi:ABC-type amino acid transport substrate-binding protein
MRRAVKRAVFIALLSALHTVPAAAGALERIRDRGTITMGYIQDAVPFSFLGADGQPQGYSVDLCREVAIGLRAQLKLPKLETRWVPLTVQDRLEAVRTGRVDIECSTTTWTLSRNAEVDFSLITFVDGGSILTRSGAALGRLRDFDGRRLAVITGTTTEKVLREALAQRAMKTELVAVTTRVEGLKLLGDAKVDGFAADRTTLIGVVATRGASPALYALLEEDFSVEPYVLAFARGDHDLRLAVNRVLARLYRSGDIVTIYNRWLGTLGPPSLLLSATYFVQGIGE